MMKDVGMKGNGHASSPCEHCNYPLFAYHQCCPMCSQPVKTRAAANSNVAQRADLQTKATTRFDFWLASWRRSFQQQNTSGSSV